MEDINNIINVAQTLKKKDTQKSDTEYKEKNTEEIKSEQQEQNLIIIDEKQKTDITEQTDEMKETTEERKTQLIEDFKEIRQQDEKELISEATHESGNVLPQNQEVFRELRKDFARSAVTAMEYALEKGDTSGQYADVYYAARAYQAHVVKKGANDDELESALLARLDNAVNTYMGSHKKNPYTKRGKNRRNAVMSVKKELDRIKAAYNNADVMKEKPSEKKCQKAKKMFEDQQKSYGEEITHMKTAINVKPVYDSFIEGSELISWMRASMIIDGATESYKNVYTALYNLQRSYQNKENFDEVRTKLQQLSGAIGAYESTHKKPKTQKGIYRLEMCKVLKRWSDRKNKENNDKNDYEKISNATKQHLEEEKRKNEGLTEKQIAVKKMKFSGEISVDNVIECVSVMEKADIELLQKLGFVGSDIDEETFAGIQQFAKDFMKFVQEFVDTSVDVLCSSDISARPKMEKMKDYFTLKEKAKKYHEAYSEGANSKLGALFKQIADDIFVKNLAEEIKARARKKVKPVADNKGYNKLYSNYEAEKGKLKEFVFSEEEDKYIDEIMEGIIIDAHRIVFSIQMEFENIKGRKDSYASISKYTEELIDINTKAKDWVSRFNLRVYKKLIPQKDADIEMFDVETKENHLKQDNSPYISSIEDKYQEFLRRYFTIIKDYIPKKLKGVGFDEELQKITEEINKEKEAN